MADTGRTPDTSWRDDEIGRLGNSVGLLGSVIYELENLHAMLETDGRTRVCQEVRNLQAALRAEAADRLGKQRDLRAAGEPPVPVLPMSITSRSVHRLRHLPAHLDDELA